MSQPLIPSTNTTHTGLLIASDHITGSNGGPAPNAWKGDLWALGGATFYGLSNVFEEFLVSQRPMYEVIGQLAFWGMFINGTQAGIFDRTSFRNATWNSAVGGYLTGYTFVLTLFYSLAPLMFRLASAAFFNLSLLTGMLCCAVRDDYVLTVCYRQLLGRGYWRQSLSFAYLQALSSGTRVDYNWTHCVLLVGVGAWRST
jgi:drug/metabolite transporter (DMT)-like permease